MTLAETLLGTNVLRGLVGCAYIVEVLLLSMVHECPVLQSLRRQYAALLFTDSRAIEIFFRTAGSRAGFRPVFGLSP